MNPKSGSPRAAYRSLPNEPAILDTPAHERAMLLELATDLQRWPARNVVFREALDRVARDLAQLASQAETGREPMNFGLRNLGCAVEAQPKQDRLAASLNQ